MQAFLQLTIQYRSDDGYPVVAALHRGARPVVRSEGRLQLDEDALVDLSVCESPAEYGRTLGMKLFCGPLREAFLRARAASPDQLRVLLDVEPAELRVLRWEWLHAPLTGERWDFLALDQRSLLSLYTPSAAEREFAALYGRQLRALVVVASPAGLLDFGLEPFDEAAVVAAVMAGLGPIPAQLLTLTDVGLLPYRVGPPTLDALCEQLTAQRYPLLHVVCHGQARRDGETILYLSDPHGRVQPVPGSELLERLGRLRGASGLPHFVFLSTCESAPAQAELGLGGLAQRLVRELGVPAVLAMNAKVGLDLALDLARRFYPRLLVHGEPDRALAEANAVLVGHADAMIPVLYSRLRAQPLFALTDAPDELDDDDIEQALGVLTALLPGQAPGALADLLTLAGTLRSNRAHRQGSPPPAADPARAQLAALCAKTLELPLGDLLRGGARVQALAQPGRCPFPGLNAFQDAEAEFFFGRERMIERMAARVVEHQFLAVLGPSGSGKSSVVLAGLCPKLRRQLPGLRVARCTPGRDPWQRLQRALTELLPTPEAPASRGLLVIDGFEECFTLCTNLEERTAFIDALLAQRGRLLLVLTLRADYWGDCAIATALQEAIAAHHELVAPLSPGELAQAIERQAASVGLCLEPDLLAALLHDLQEEPGAMPLLQHALRELWQRRRGRRLWARDYRQVGGVQKALAETADAIYAAALPADRERLREIFTRLIQLDADAAPGEPRRDARRRVEVTDLIPAGDSPEPIRRMVAALADARLCVLRCDGPTGEQTLEVAHEALIRHWPQLRRWLDEDRIALSFREGVRQAARAWQADGNPPHLLLHRGERLELVRKLEARPRGAWNLLERAYLDACAEHQAEELRREQAHAEQLAAALAQALAAARRAESRQLAMHSASAREQQPQLALLLARAAIEREPTCEAVSQLYGALLQTFDLLTLGPHPDAVTAATFSPDGGSVLTVAVDKAARLWSATGELLATLVGHEEALTDASFSPSGARIVTAARDGTARLWAPDGTQLACLRGHRGAVLGARFSPDGSQVLSFGQDGTARLWTAEGEPGRELPRHLEALTDGRFSPDGEHLVTVSYDGAVRVWDRHGALRSSFSAHAAPIASVCFSPDGERLLTASWDCSARLWDRDGHALAVLSGHMNRVLAASFSPDGEQVLTASRDRTARLWTLAGETLAVLQGHETGLLGACFSPDGTRVLTVANDPYACLWDAHGQLIARLRGHRRPLTCASMSPDGATVLTGSWDGTARLWPGGGAALPVLRGHQNAVTCGTFEPTGSGLATAGQDGRIGLWSATGRLRRMLTGHTEEITACRFSPDGEQLLTASRDQRACLWSLDSGRAVWLPGHTSWVTSAAFSPDGRLALTTSLDQTARLWRRDGRLLTVLRQHTGAVHTGAFNRDGTAVLTAGADGTARVFAIDGTLRATLRGHTDCIAGLALSPDGQLVLTCSWDGTARLWQLDGTAGAVLSGHTSWVLGGGFSPDGALVLTYGRDAVARLWEPSGQCIAILRGHQAPISWGSFSPDGATVVTLSQDGTARLWTRAGRRLATLSGHQDALLSGAFSRDGAWLLTTGADQLARLWPANLGALRSLAEKLAARAFTPEERDEYLSPDEPAAQKA